MADPHDRRSLNGWFLTLCAALAVLSLTAHFVADAVCKSPEFVNARPCGSAGSSNATGAEQLTTSSLHSGYMLPIMGAIGSLLTVTFALATADSIPLHRFFPPPVRPPIASF